MVHTDQYNRRPFGLYIIIALQLGIALFLALALLGETRISPYLRLIISNPFFYRAYGWVLVGFLLLAVIGLVRLKRWGWTLTMILTGFSLALSILNYFQGSPNYIVMISDIVIVFYLNQRDVQAPFTRSSHPRETQ